MDSFDRRPPAAGIPGPFVHTVDFRQQPCADRLVERRYADRGYINSLLSSHSEPALTVCSAFEGSKTVGTIAVRFETARGLNADAVFAAELATFRAAGLRICEFTRLAVDEDAKDNKKVLARLFHLAYLHAHRLAGCELLVIEVNPRHVPFYKRMLGLKVCSEMRIKDSVGAPAVLMSLDLAEACEQIGLYGGSPEMSAQTRTLYPFAYSPDDEAVILAKLRQ